VGPNLELSPEIADDPSGMQQRAGRIGWWWWAGLALGAVTAACAPEGEGGRVTCGVIGQTQRCVCAGGAEGGQSCGADGRWGACACGPGADVGDGEVDTSPPVDTSTPTETSADAGDTGPDVPGDEVAETTGDGTSGELEDAPVEEVVAPRCDPEALPVARDTFAYGPGFLHARLTLDSGDERLDVMWKSNQDGGGGVTPALTGPGEFTIEPAAEVDMFSCQVCVTLWAGCADGSCDRLFVGDGGLIDIDAVDLERLSLSGRLEGVRLVEATADYDTSTMTLVPDGEVRCLEGALDAAPKCRSDADCGDPTRPLCDPDATTNTESCIGCRSDYDCGAEAPACLNFQEVCGPGPTCSGDDAYEPNDGPSEATPLPFGTPLDAYGCGTTDESDYYRIVLGAARDVVLDLTWSMGLVNTTLETEAGEYVESSGSSGDLLQRVYQASYDALPAGTYYIRVYAAVSSPYRLQLTTP